jgi:hypothetical protein
MEGSQMRAASQGNAAEAARRILSAIRAGETAGLKSELDRAAAVCDGPWRDSGCEERAELLEVVVDAIRRELLDSGARPPLEAETALLTHLAGLT